jgi:uncharacterized RDD family membrane protein YckC
MDYGNAPGDELDPQAAPRPEAPLPPPAVQQPSSPQQSWPQQHPPQQVMAPIPGAVAYENTVLVPAGFGPRLLAFLIDMVMLGILVQIFKMLVGYQDPDPDQVMNAMRHFFRTFDAQAIEHFGPPGWVTFLQYCIYAAYYSLFHAFNGATLGKMALGLQVRQRDGQPLSFMQAALRWLGYWLTGWLAYTAWMISIDREKRTAYDAVLKLNVFKVMPKNM